MKEKRIEWGEIGRLDDGKLVVYNKKTKKIKIESDYMYARNPLPEERKEVLIIVKKKMKKMQRWQKIIELIQKKL